MSWISASSTGASLSANNTFTGANTFSATTTLATTTITGLTVSGIPTLSGVSNCNGSTYLQITSGLFGCGTPAGGSGNSAWTIGNGFIYNATSTDAVEIGNGSSTPIAGSLVLSSAGTTTPSFTLLHTNGTSAIEMRDGGASYSNTYIGYQAGQKETIGQNNTALGYGALAADTSGGDNIAIGYKTLNKVAGGNANIAMGYSSQSFVSSGGNNVSIGESALANLQTGSSNVALGYNAGYNETGSNHFYVNNINQTSLANDKAYSLLYGNFAGTAGTTAGQFLDTNGVLDVNTTTLASVMTIQATSSASTVPFLTVASSSGTTLFSVSGTGTVQQSAEKSCSTGLTTDSSGNINGCVASSRLVKKNISSLPYDPTLIDKLRPVLFDYIDNRDDHQSAGFIAEEVGKIIPQCQVPAGKYNGQDITGVDSNCLLAVVINQLQHQPESTSNINNNKREQIQDILIGLLICYVIYNEVQKRKKGDAIINK